MVSTWLTIAFRQAPFTSGGGPLYLNVEGVGSSAIERTDTYASPPEPNWLFKVQFVEGARFRMGFLITNRSSFDVTLTSVDPGPEPGIEYETLLDPIAISIGDSPGELSPSEASPFRPTELESQEYRLLVLDYRFVCRHGPPKSLEVREFFDVNFEVLGISRSQQVRLPARIALRFPDRDQCQDR